MKQKSLNRKDWTVWLLLPTLIFINFGYVKKPEISEASRPNVIFILTDDLGYGDVKCLNPNSKIATPHMDKMAEQGMIFTDAHTSSSVCTPSRYSILTGRYAWRTHLQSSVLNGFSPPLIDPKRATVASFLQQQGYNTACIGKWHLGMNFPMLPNEKLPNEEYPRYVGVDWKGTIKNGPLSNGFNYYYGISASLDMPPYIYIENDKFVGECTVEKGFNRKGQAHKDFEAVDVVPEIGRKTVEYIKKQNAQTPFFAYVPLTSPHTPILPSKEWQGKSIIGKYGDFVMQTDDIIGQIVAAVDEMGLGENTLIIVTSDNGCSKSAGIAQMAKQGHDVSYIYRGSKADLWDGGHRVPFIVRWSSKIKAGTTNNDLICLTDFFATLSDITNKPLPDDNAEDSYSFLPALMGKPIVNKRQGIINHSINGHFAYRTNKWKLLLSKGSGGWSSPTEKEAVDVPVAQLYDMEKDPSEKVNLYNTNPKMAKTLLKQLEMEIKTGRSTKGKALKNDVENIVLWKSGDKNKASKNTKTD